MIGDQHLSGFKLSLLTSWLCAHRCKASATSIFLYLPALLTAVQGAQNGSMHLQLRYAPKLSFEVATDDPAWPQTTQSFAATIVMQQMHLRTLSQSSHPNVFDLQVLGCRDSILSQLARSLREYMGDVTFHNIWVWQRTKNPDCDH